VGGADNELNKEPDLGVCAGRSPKGREDGLFSSFQSKKVLRMVNNMRLHLPSVCTENEVLDGLDWSGCKESSLLSNCVTILAACSSGYLFTELPFCS
jgi:hypothetical protein